MFIPGGLDRESSPIEVEEEGGAGELLVGLSSLTEGGAG